MSQLDSELQLLRIRLAALEEQKRTEDEKKTFPLKTLEGVVDKYKSIGYGGSNKFRNERYYKSKETLAFLEPILDILKNIQERLDILEKKSA